MPEKVVQSDVFAPRDRCFSVKNGPLLHLFLLSVDDISGDLLSLGKRFFPLPISLKDGLSHFTFRPSPRFRGCHLIVDPDN